MPLLVLAFIAWSVLGFSLCSAITHYTGIKILSDELNEWIWQGRHSSLAHTSTVSWRDGMHVVDVVSYLSKGAEEGWCIFMLLQKRSTAASHQYDHQIWSIFALADSCFNKAPQMKSVLCLPCLVGSLAESSRLSQTVIPCLKWL